MKKVLMLPILFSLFLSSASAGIDLIFSETNVKQGSLQVVEIRETQDLAGKIALEEMVGRTIDDTLYIESIEGSDNKKYAVIVFTKVPEKNSLNVVVSGQNTTISWSGVTVEQIEVPKGFIFGDFTIPEPLSLVKFFLGLFFFTIASILGRRFFKKYKEKRAIKKRREELMQKLTSCRNFEDVVLIWLDKKKFISEFPKTEEPFKGLEKVLYRYQFKPSQSNEEKDDVMKEYRRFVDHVIGGRHGV